VVELLGVMEVHEEYFFRRRQAIFVGYDVDNPTKQLDDVPWNKTLKARRHSELLSIVADTANLEKWLTTYNYNLCQSVILPVPRKQYLDFVKDFEC
jgi:hypothetical protein